MKLGICRECGSEDFVCRNCGMKEKENDKQMDVFSRIEHIMRWGRAHDYNMIIMGDWSTGVLMVEKDEKRFEISMEEIHRLELGDVALLIDRTYNKLVNGCEKKSKWCTECDEYEIDSEIEFISDDMLREVYENYKEVEWFGQQAIEYTLKRLMIWERFCIVNEERK